MLNPSNSLTILRAPLAFLFLYDSLYVRLGAVVLAMITDIIDGYLARRYKFSSKLGALLDPIMDKFFVFFILAVFYFEKSLSVKEILLMVSRDLFLCFFGFHLLLKKSLKSFNFQSVLSGKLSTALQFAVIIFLTAQVHIPLFVFALFPLLGLLVFTELFSSQKNQTPNKQV